MRERPYRLGLVLGRFQGLHIGHEAVIRKALSVCDRVIVMIGSADKEGTAHDPFSAKLRREMLEAVFPRLVRSGRVIIVPLNDLGVGNVPAWGDYVIANAKRWSACPNASFTATKTSAAPGSRTTPKYDIFPLTVQLLT